MNSKKRFEKQKLFLERLRFDTKNDFLSIINDRYEAHLEFSPAYRNMLEIRMRKLEEKEE